MLFTPRLVDRLPIVLVIQICARLCESGVLGTEQSVEQIVVQHVCGIALGYDASMIVNPIGSVV